MDSNKSDIIDKTIVHFKIRDLNIDKFYTEGFTSSLYKESREQKNVDITVDISNDNDSFNNFEKDEVIEDEKFRCSFDISNVCMNNNKHFIFDAVSCIDDEDLRGTTKETNEKRGTTIIYPIKLLKDEKENYIILVELEFQIYCPNLCRAERAEKSKKKKMGVSNRLLMPNYLHNEFNDPISTPNAKETTIRCPCQELGDLGKRELKKKYFVWAVIKKSNYTFIMAPNQF
ncbi:hypothetical protein RhiirC2_864042 [Rhizophagus irregularis]|uniref:Uncharacterized protein n=1 Tax=Rhizophagus irregularis TaxID=588596 RepID=A0A2N1NJL8_9GLOM|nr:hypothetical protein RhiirC2_864042 [Rhizophagus irregularis]